MQKESDDKSAEKSAESAEKIGLKSPRTVLSFLRCFMVKHIIPNKRKNKKCKTVHFPTFIRNT